MTERRDIPTRGLVLEGGTSDHRPFLKDLWYSAPGMRAADPVRFCTFNCAKGDVGDRGRRDDLDKVVERILDFEPDILGWQEVKPGDGILRFLRDVGYRVRYESPEFLVAGHRRRFDVVKWSGLIMSEHNYWLDRNEALSVVFEDKLVGVDLRAISSHPPAHIVRKDHPTWQNVYEVHKDVAARRRRIARNGVKNNLPTVDMRDSNIDPRKDRPAVGRNWDWAYFNGPMKYIRAPEPTHGGANGRHIDEMGCVLMSRTPPGHPG